MLPTLMGAMKPVFAEWTHKLFHHDKTRASSAGGASVKADELPYHTKFLLISAFLASYNPPDADVTFFVTKGSGRKRRRGSVRQKPNVRVLVSATAGCHMVRLDSASRITTHDRSEGVSNGTHASNI